MHQATRQALNRLNHAFYAGATASEFSRTRRAPWPGWDRVLALPLPRAPRVLDVGCGNGRFARALSRRHADARYTGVDLSPALLAEARQRGGLVHARFSELDLVAHPDALPAGPFDLAVAWGLLHHIPGREARAHLLHALGARLSPGGLLAWSTWTPAFRRTSPALEHALAELAGGELETGDTLVKWGTGEGAVRYVHLADDAEQRERAHRTGLATVARFVGDAERGDHNVYVVQQRTGSP